METPLLSLHLPEDGEDNNITIAASFNSASASDSEIQFQILQWGDSDSGSHHNCSLQAVGSALVHKCISALHLSGRWSSS